MSLAQFLRILIARRMIILTTFITCVVVAVTVAKFLPERYPARARVLLDIVKPDPVTGEMITPNAARGYVRTQIELIQDYRIAGDVVDKLGWAQNPSVQSAWQAETGGNGDFRRWAAQRIINGTDVGLVEGSNILEITYQSPDPDLSKQIVTLLREAYIDNSLKFKTDSAGRTADWYREQADKAQHALTDAENARIKFEQENGIVVGPTGETETNRLSALQQSLIAARSGQTVTEARSGGDVASQTGIVDQLKMQQATLNDQIEQAGEKLGVQHPAYKALLSRKRVLDSELGREEGRARQAMAQQTGASGRIVAELERDYEAQRVKVMGMKDKLNQLAQLQREVDLRRSQYEKAAARTADLRLESNVSESGLVILGDAIGTAVPSFPNWPQIWGLSAAFGLGLGLVLAVFTELLKRRIRGTDDLGFASKSPVFAVIADVAPSPWRDRIRRLLSRRRPADTGWQPAQ